MTEHNDLAAYDFGVYHDFGADDAPDLSIEGIERIEAALNAAGVKTYYHETDGESFLDIQLRDLADDDRLTLSWRADGWQVTECADGTPCLTWRVRSGARLDAVAAEVARIVDEIDGPVDIPQQTGIPALDTWAAANGWTWTWGYYRWISPDGNTGIGYDDGEVGVWRKTPGAHIRPESPFRYPVDPERAVDLLVALRILPDTLHRLYPQVATVAELTDEVTALRMQVRLERCRADRWEKRAENAGGAR